MNAGPRHTLRSGYRRPSGRARRSAGGRTSLPFVKLLCPALWPDKANIVGRRRYFKRNRLYRAPGFLTVSTPCRSEEHTSELQSLMRISYAVFCLKKKTIKKPIHHTKTKK